MLDVPADSSRRDAERLCCYLCRNPSGRRGAFAARCRVTAACMVLSHGRMLDPSDPTRKTLETILAAVLCELGVQYERTSALRGVPCMSRITEVRGSRRRVRPRLRAWIAPRCPALRRTQVCPGVYAPLNRSTGSPLVLSMPLVSAPP